MTWDSQYVIANQVIIEGSNDGLFVYAGAPATGNLIVSAAAQAGTDPYGNAYPQGINVTQGRIGTTSGARVVLDATSSQILMFNAGGAETGFWSAATQTLGLQSADGKAYQVFTINPFGQPEIDVNPDNTKFSDGYLQSFFNGVGPYTSSLILASPFGLSDSDGVGNASITLTSRKTDLTGSRIIELTADTIEADNGIIITGEIWHALPLTNSWSNSANPPAAQYRKIASPPNSIEVVGRIAHAAVSGSSQVATALPVGYRPAHTQDLAANVFGNSAAPVASPVLTLDTAGVLTLFDLPTGTTNASFHNIYSLDA